jgi:Lipase maturation factor
MWFAALGRYESEEWFRAFCIRLLAGSSDVRQLLARDPFAGRTPKRVRGELYRYHFSDRDTGRRESVWWTRERLGEYSPPLSIGASP